MENSEIRASIPTMRLFVALWPDDERRRQLAEVAQRWPTPARPVTSDNFHVTLTFLGSVPQSIVPPLCRALQAVSFEPCELVFDHVEFWHRGLVVVCPQSIPLELVRLHEHLLRTLEPFELEQDKLPFRPHVTLARNVMGRVAMTLSSPLHWPVRDFVLACSDPPGPYQVLQRFA